MTAAGVDQADQLVAELVEAEADLVVDLVVLLLEAPSQADHELLLGSDFLVVVLDEDQADHDGSAEVVVVVDEDHSDQEEGSLDLVVVVVEDHSDQVVAGSVVVVVVDDQAPQLLSSAMVVEAVAAPTMAAAAM